MSVQKIQSQNLLVLYTGTCSNISLIRIVYDYTIKGAIDEKIKF